MNKTMIKNEKHTKKNNINKRNDIKNIKFKNKQTTKNKEKKKKQQHTQTNTHTQTKNTR